ncbi:TetR/AcrR family transcriptional regulator [Rhizobium sp. BE258]|jgi:AcrR family transcriptional regulator|uniref:TetR/AcrR family transcriptional regulator n=1 Tax=Rhizobium sp. BE258 TaxID=2817722 RepID=UPI0028656A99|nr:TetR/AcrR family transcriptional regulator [Rhizobium sp. BE258]MDR7145510.1 AcrR family transcriptional regulator [Rhizobium sp. BE258]
MSERTTEHQRRLPPAGRGRIQDKSRDDVIIEATLELLAEKGYHGLTMTDVAARAGVSKATLYRRWTAKADVVADAVATLSPMKTPRYSGTSLREDLIALLEQAASCDDRPEIVTATFEMARAHPDLYRTLSTRFANFVREELDKLAKQASAEGHPVLSDVELDVLSDTVIALLAHNAGPAGKSIPRERLVGLVDNVLMILFTATRAAT